MERAERSKGLEEDEVEGRENVGLDVRCGLRIKFRRRKGEVPRLLILQNFHSPNQLKVHPGQFWSALG